MKGSSPQLRHTEDQPVLCNIQIPLSNEIYPVLSWYCADTAIPILGFPGGASGKESVCQCTRSKRHVFDPWVWKIPGGGHGNPLQYSCLENPRDRGAWWAAVYGMAQSRTRLKWLSSSSSMLLRLMKLSFNSTVLKCDKIQPQIICF